MSDQPNAHIQSSQQGENEILITTAKWYSGTLGPKVSWHLSCRWEKTQKKNLTQETCPDRGSNPGPLRDKREYYHLLHSVGLILMCWELNENIVLDEGKG